EAIPPLPNLDRNILQGNSLLSPIDFLGDGRGDVYRDWLAAIRAQSDLVARYRNAPRSERPALARLIHSNDQRLAAELLAKPIDIASSARRPAAMRPSISRICRSCSSSVRSRWPLQPASLRC